MARLDASALLSELTLEEKASLCLGSDFWHTAPVERLAIPAVMVADGPHGLRKQPDDVEHAGNLDSVPATCFPTAVSLASSWDVDLVRRVGDALGREASALRVSVVLGPGVNMKRSPLCGRNFEYFSEDPLLAGTLGAAMVDGIQSHHVGTSVKHFAANNQEHDRMRVSADVDERTLREIYLPAFERIIKDARPWTVMCAYNKVNGTLASQDRWLLTEVLRDEWGFDGLVMSDWGAVADRVVAVEAGLDLEMPPNLDVSAKAIVDAVRSGQLDEAFVDQSVRRVLELVDRSQGALEQPAEFDVDAHHALAREVARDCLVLLKNDGGALPLATDATIAVIGEFAQTPRFQGAGSSQVNPTRVISALDALRECHPKLVFAAGYTLDATDAGDDELTAEAVAAASDADVAVVFLGLPGSAESEGFDRTDIDLPTAQLVLLQAVADANPHIVVVLTNGAVVRTSNWEHLAPAVLAGWLPGQAGGGAIADVLTGAHNPSGRLAETIPTRLADNPSYLNFPGSEGHVRYGEGVFIGYRWYDARHLDVSYPFGHGLSYTSFGYSDLSVDSTDGLPVAVSLTVSNTGDVVGKEVVQLYVAEARPPVERPPRELKAFAKVALAPGESTRLTFALDERAFAYWSTEHGGWVMTGGRYQVDVGASSRDIRAGATVELPGNTPRTQLDAGSTLREWNDDQIGGPLLREALGFADGSNPDHPMAGAVMDLIGSMPIGRMAAFPGLGFEDIDLDAMIDEAISRAAAQSSSAPQGASATAQT